MFSAWPHDLAATTNMALNPPSPSVLWDLFERGRADAAAWAKQQGFPDEVLRRLVLSGGGGGATDGTGLVLVNAAAPELPAELRVFNRLQQQQQGDGARQMMMAQEQQQRTVDEAAAGMQQVAAAAGKAGD